MARKVPSHTLGSPDHARRAGGEPDDRGDRLSAEEQIRFKDLLLDLPAVNPAMNKARQSYVALIVPSR